MKLQFLRKIDTVQGDMYHFLRFFGLEFFKKVTKFIFQEASFFCTVNFNIFLEQKKRHSLSNSTKTSQQCKCKRFMILPACQRHLLTQNLLVGSLHYNVGPKNTKKSDITAIIIQRNIKRQQLSQLIKINRLIYFTINNL